MVVELLNINGIMMPHTIIPIIGDGACLFRAISFVLYDTQDKAQEVRKKIVTHVINNWEDYSIMSHDSDGNNYRSSADYFSDMLKFNTYGGICELVAAGQLFLVFIEVFLNGELYEKFGSERNPVKRFRFSSMQNLSNGHFDVYLPYEDELINSVSDEFDNIPSSQKHTKKRRKRFKNNIRKKQLMQSFTKYQLKNKEVHKVAAAKYKKKNPEVNRVQVHRYEQNNPGGRSERRILPWKIKAFSGMKYESEIAYETDETVSLGTMSHKCVYFDALKFKEEAPGMCCSAGKVQLPSFLPLPGPLYSLIMGFHPDHKNFMDRIRKYNNCFQITSFGAKQIIEDGFMPTFKMKGQVYHLIGSLQALPQQNPQFLQIYFVGDDERETRLRCSHFADVKQSLVKQLQAMLHHNNPYIKDLKITLERVPQNSKNFEIIIHADRKPDNAHRGRYNAPTKSEVSLVIVGQQFEKRDIVLQSHDNKLQRINELHRSYDTLQYPLLFCHGEDGYPINISQIDPKTKLPLQKTVSASQFYSYHIMIRQTEINHLLYLRSLFNQYLVDMYAKIETVRLNFIKNNQMQLRADNYIHLRDAIGRQDTDLTHLGQMVVLPSSFTGSPQYMHEKTQDTAP